MNVGEYVRTKDGYIGKITKIEQNERIHYMQKLIYTDNWKDLDMVLEETIIKSSPQIIDLIEKNDYINGNKIIKISQDHCGRTILIYGYDDSEKQVIITIYEEDIKTIVTHEQMEAMQYRVEG